MKKVAYVSLMGMLLCLPFSFIYADEFLCSDDFEKSSAAIYFCTRDVEEYESTGIPSDKSLDNYPDSIIVVGNKDSTKHKYLRHCFVLLANEIVVDSSTNNDLILKIGTGFSLGYYPSGGGRGTVLSEDGWLFDKKKRDERAVSCTPIEISKKIDGDIPLDENDIYSAWYTIKIKMDEDLAKNPYFDRFKHNCCSVVFERLRRANKESDYSFDLSNIKKRNYNILGRGISFSRSDDSTMDYVVGCGKLSKGVFRTIKIIVMKKIQFDNSNNQKSDNDDEL